MRGDPLGQHRHGPLGLEWANFLGNAGAEVTVVEDSETLRSVDDEAPPYFGRESSSGAGELPVDAVVFADFRTPAPPALASTASA